MRLQAETAVLLNWFLSFQSRYLSGTCYRLASSIRLLSMLRQSHWFSETFYAGVQCRHATPKAVMLPYQTLNIQTCCLCCQTRTHNAPASFLNDSQFSPFSINAGLGLPTAEHTQELQIRPFISKFMLETNDYGCCTFVDITALGSFGG